MAGVLYMVATPIGNLGDFSSRAKEIFGTVNFIACEDTRVTKKLLAHLGINKELVSLHHHSSEAVLKKLTARLLNGESAAYVSDAGTPGLADPGGKLVAMAANENIKVVPIPGASAVTAILSIAGLPANSYLFLGYPPHKKGRQKFFIEAANCAHAVVFFESTHRIVKALTEIAKLIGDRQMVVGRELTKMYETIYRGSAEEILGQLAKTSTKGEFVVALFPI